MTGLRRQPNRLIGRERERVALTALLADDETRLVTITGPGGIGKTRLAMDVAAISDRIVTIVEFAAIRDADLFLSALAGELGVSTLIGGDLRSELHRVLEAGRHLLVLDNLEHLAAAGKDIAWLISLDADIRVLVTSRSPLQVQGEREFALHPLDSSGAAVDLFVERAEQANREFAVDQESRATITRISERLDGLPLAIELAAARMKVVSPEVLESMLDSRLAMLTGGEQDRPSRHRTMRDAIAWSFDLLSPSQQELFARVSVFEGGFALREATLLAEGMDGPAETFRTLDGLTGLIDASLLIRDDSDGEPRFGMLETIRAFGLEQLDRRVDGVETREQHARLFLDLAEASRSAMRGSERTLWLDRLDAAQANLRVAMTWFVDHGRTEDALRLAGSLWQFFWWRSHVIDGRKMLDAAVRLPNSGDCPVLLAQCLTGFGALTETMGRYAEAEEYHHRAELLLAESGDLRAIADACLFRWLISFNAEDSAGMTQWSSRSLELFRGLRDQWGIAMSLMEQGVMAMRLREHERATAVLTESQTLFEAVGDEWGVAICRGVQSNVETDRKEFARALQLQRQSLTALWSLNDLWGVATVLPAAARLAAELGQIELAVRISGAIAAMHGEIGAPLKVPFRERFEQTLGAARPALGGERFEQIWAEGQGIGPDAAIALIDQIRVEAGGKAEGGTETTGPLVPLSPREREVLRLVPTNSARKIGEQLFISESTVRTHIDNILTKYGAKNQKELIAMMFEQRPA